MEFEIKQKVEFDVDKLAEIVIEDLYNDLECGHYEEEWKCLTLDQQEELIKAIVEKVVEIVKEGE